MRNSSWGHWKGLAALAESNSWVWIRLSVCEFTLLLLNEKGMREGRDLKYAGYTGISTTNPLPSPSEGFTVTSPHPFNPCFAITLTELPISFIDLTSHLFCVIVTWIELHIAKAAATLTGLDSVRVTWGVADADMWHMPTDIAYCKATPVCPQRNQTKPRRENIRKNLVHDSQDCLPKQQRPPASTVNGASTKEAWK